MREIKFRGRKMKNGDYVYGDLIHNGDKTYIVINYGMKVRVKPNTVKQFIMRDSNGVELYEDDIVDIFTPDRNNPITLGCYIFPSLAEIFALTPEYKVTLKT